MRSANKSTDPELLGQEAWVARVEHNGWVELQIPRLGEGGQPRVGLGVDAAPGCVGVGGTRKTRGNRVRCQGSTETLVPVGGGGRKGQQLRGMG